MTFSTDVLIFIVGGTFALLGWALNKTYLLAAELTKLRSALDNELETAKKDRNGLGDKIRQLESKFFAFATLTCPDKLKIELMNSLTRRHN